MQFLAVATLFLAGAIAQPLEARTNGPACPDGLFSNPQCCSGDILGIIGVDCAVPINSFNDARSLKDECARVGQQARCCVAPVAGQSLLCQHVPGAN